MNGLRVKNRHFQDINKAFWLYRICSRKNRKPNQHFELKKVNFLSFHDETFLMKNGIDIPWTFYSTQNWFPGDVTWYHVMLKNVIFLTFHLRNSLFRKTYILSIYLIDLEVINQKAVYQTPHPITWWSDLYRYTYCISYTVYVQYIIKSKYDVTVTTVSAVGY